jgi:Mg-chelatase subunit ChlI
VEGHRADYLLALATSAYAARYQQEYTTLEGLRTVAELVLRHRLTEESGVSPNEWGDEHAQLVDKILAYVA